MKQTIHIRNLDAFLNIASNACLIARLFVQSLVMSDPHHNYEKKAGSLWSNLDGGLPLGILRCYGWHTGASCFLHRLSGNWRDSGGTFDFWRTNTAASGEWRVGCWAGILQCEHDEKWKQAMHGAMSDRW